MLSVVGGDQDVRGPSAREAVATKVAGGAAGKFLVFPDGGLCSTVAHLVRGGSLPATLDEFSEVGTPSRGTHGYRRTLAGLGVGSLGR